MNRHAHPAASAAQRPSPSLARHKAAEEPPADSAGGFVAFLRTLPLTAGVTLIAALLLLTAAAAVAAMTSDPTAVARPAAYVALAATALVGGIIAGRQNPDHPVLGALGAGVVLALVTALLAIPVGAWIPAPDRLTDLSLSAGANGGDTLLLPAVGQAVTVAQAAFMRLGLVVLHPVAAYITRPRPRAPEHSHPATGHPAHASRHAHGHPSARR